MKVTFIKTGKRVKPKEEKVKDNKKTKILNEKINIIKNRTNNVVQNKSNNKITQNKEKNEVFQSEEKRKTDVNKGEIFKTVFRKNQVVLLTLALMLVTAGYMNYTNSNNELNISLADVGDAQLVSTNAVDENTTTNENAVKTENEIKTEHEVSSNVVENEVSSNASDNTVTNSTSEEVTTSNAGKNEATSETISNINQVTDKASSGNQDYYTQTRLERQTMYSQMLEAYQKILENEKIPADQKSIAANEIKNINDRINAIAIIENLIKTKGFEDVIILINDNNINVVVKQDNNLSQEQVAQITNIVSRELKSEIEDIHITVQK